MRSVVCGVAGDDGDVPLLRLGAELAHRLDCALHAVHAYQPGALPAHAPGPRRTLSEMLDRAEVEARGTVLPLRPPEALERVAKEERAGLVVVGSRGHSRPESVLHGSVPTRLAAEGTTAVMVLPQRTRLERGSGHYELAADAA
jgi:nucleotide-binding universal stress UspA family protein